MKQVRKKNTLYILAALLIVLFTSLLFVKRNFDVILKERIISSFEDAFKGEYEISVNNVTTSLLTGSAVLNGLYLKSKPLPENGVLDSKIESLEISGISWKKLIRKKEFSFNKVAISSPDIFFREPKLKVKENDFLQLLPKFLSELSHSVNIRQLEIKNGKISYVTGGNDKRTINSASDINLILDGISVMNGKDPYIISENVFVSLKNICLEKENRKALSISSLLIDSENSLLQAENVSLDNLPIKGLLTSGFVKTVSTEDIKIPKSLQEYQLEAGKIKFSSGELNIIESKEKLLSKSSLKLPSSINLKDIAFDNIKINVQAYHKTKKSYYSGIMEKVSIEDIEKEQGKNFVLNNIEFDIKSFEMTDQLHQNLKIKSINGSTENQELSISELIFNQNESSIKPGVFLKIKNITGKVLDYKNFQKSRLAANLLRIEKPELEVSFSPDVTIKEQSKQSLNSLIEKFTEDYFASTAVKNIDIRNGNLKLNYHDGLDELKQSFTGVNIQTGGFLLNPDKKDQPLNSRDLSAFVAKYEIASDQANFIIKAEDIFGEGNSNKISGSNVSISQKTSNGANQPYYFTTAIDSFAATDISFDDLLNNTKVDAGKVEATGMNLIVDLDERKSLEGGSKVLPKDIFQSIPFSIDIKELSVTDSKILYKNQVKGNYDQSSLSFEDFSLTTNRISNDPNFQDRSELKIDGLLNGKGYFKFNASIPFMSSSFSCKYYGSLGSMEGAEFNNWLAYADIGIRKGKLNNLHYSVEIENGKAKASVAMLYEDLRLDVFNKKGKKKRLTSFLSRLVIHKSNMAGRKPAEAVFINCAIPPEYSFFYSLWHPIKEGMTQTVTKDFYMPAI